MTSLESFVSGLWEDSYSCIGEYTYTLYKTCNLEDSLSLIRMFHVKHSYRIFLKEVFDFDIFDKI